MLRFTLPMALAAAFPALGMASAASAQDRASPAEDSAAPALPEGLGEAIMLGCLPVLTGTIDISDGAKLDEAMRESGFQPAEARNPLLSAITPKGSEAAYFERALQSGKLAFSIAKDNPFCTIAFSELQEAKIYADAAAAHFESAETPFSFRAEEAVSGVPMRKRIYDWPISEAQTISANLMKATFDLPKGKQFLLITMFVSRGE